MNIKNFEFLRDGLKYLGFGEKLEGDLKANIEKQPADFKLNTENEFKRGDKTEKVTYTIDFRLDRINSAYRLKSSSVISFSNTIGFSLSLPCSTGIWRFNVFGSST